MPEFIQDLPAVAILLPAASVYFLWALFHWVFKTDEDLSEVRTSTDHDNSAEDTTLTDDLSDPQQSLQNRNLKENDQPERIDTGSFSRLFPALSGPDTEDNSPPSLYQPENTSAEPASARATIRQQSASTHVTQSEGSHINDEQDLSRQKNCFPEEESEVEPEAEGRLMPISSMTNDRPQSTLKQDDKDVKQAVKSPVLPVTQLRRPDQFSSDQSPGNQVTESELEDTALQAKDKIETPSDRSQTASPTHIRPGQRKSESAILKPTDNPVSLISPNKYRTAARRKPLSPVEEVQLQLKTDVKLWEASNPSLDERALKQAHENEIAAKNNEITLLKQRIQALTNDQTALQQQLISDEETTIDRARLEHAVAELEGSARKITRLQSTVNNLQALAASANSSERPSNTHNTARESLLSKVRLVQSA